MSVQVITGVFALSGVGVTAIAAFAAAAVKHRWDKESAADAYRRDFEIRIWNERKDAYAALHSALEVATSSAGLRSAEAREEVRKAAKLITLVGHTEVRAVIQPLLETISEERSAGVTALQQMVRLGSLAGWLNYLMRFHLGLADKDFIMSREVDPKQVDEIFAGSDASADETMDAIVERVRSLAESGQLRTPPQTEGQAELPDVTGEEAVTEALHGDARPTPGTASSPQP